MGAKRFYSKRWSAAQDLLVLQFWAHLENGHVCCGMLSIEILRARFWHGHFFDFFESLAWKRNIDKECESTSVAVLNALSNDTNHAQNDRMVAEIWVIYSEHTEAEINKKSSVGGCFVMKLSNLCQYFFADIFTWKDAPSKALQNPPCPIIIVFFNFISS